MSEVSESSSSLAFSGVPGSNPGEAYGAPIITVKLDSTNFLTWFQSAKLTIMGLGEWSYMGN